MSHENTDSSDNDHLDEEKSKLQTGFRLWQPWTKEKNDGNADDGTEKDVAGPSNRLNVRKLGDVAGPSRTIDTSSDDEPDFVPKKRKLRNYIVEDSTSDEDDPIVKRSYFKNYNKAAAARQLAARAGRKRKAGTIPPREKEDTPPETIVISDSSEEENPFKSNTDSSGSDSLPEVSMNNESESDEECISGLETLTMSEEMLLCLPCQCCTACLKHATAWVKKGATNAMQMLRVSTSCEPATENCTGCQIN